MRRLNGGSTGRLLNNDMLLKDFIKTALEREYMGKTIYSCNNTTTFVVYDIIVENGGVDPQWEITLRSKLCCEIMVEQHDWYQKNNPIGNYLVPKELETRWQKGWVEYFGMSFVDNLLPEIAKNPDKN